MQFLMVIVAYPSADFKHCRELEDDGQNDKRDIGWRDRELWGIALIPGAKLLTFKTLSVGKTPTFATISAPLAVRHLRAYFGSLR